MQNKLGEKLDLSLSEATQDPITATLYITVEEAVDIASRSLLLLYKGGAVAGTVTMQTSVLVAGAAGAPETGAQVPIHAPQVPVA